LEFTKLHGVYSGENLATAIYTTLAELDLKYKLVAITGDNATNNKVMVSELYHTLKKEIHPQKKVQFYGLDSYIHCLAHILNLIVKDIL
jgi:hypothetical protein